MSSILLERCRIGFDRLLVIILSPFKQQASAVAVIGDLKRMSRSVSKTKQMAEAIGIRHYLVIAVLASTWILTSYANAALQVIGDWENSGNADPGIASDYWLDWNNGGNE